MRPSIAPSTARGLIRRGETPCAGAFRRSARLAARRRLRAMLGLSSRVALLGVRTRSRPVQIAPRIASRPVREPLRCPNPGGAQVDSSPAPAGARSAGEPDCPRGRWRVGRNRGDRSPGRDGCGAREPDAGCSPVGRPHRPGPRLGPGDSPSSLVLEFNRPIDPDSVNNDVEIVRTDSDGNPTRIRSSIQLDPRPVGDPALGRSVPRGAHPGTLSGPGAGHVGDHRHRWEPADRRRQ